MYCKLLDEVVKELQGQKVEEEIDVQIDLNVSSYIPDSFIDNSSQKIEIYQSIAGCKNEEDIGNVIDEIIDRYGKYPEEIENLLEVARVKNLAREKFVVKIHQRGNNIVYNFVDGKFNMDVLEKLIKIYKSNIKFSPSSLSPYVTVKVKNQFEVLKECKQFLNYL